jgi:hypothetical protein
LLHLLLFVASAVVCCIQSRQGDRLNAAFLAELPKAANKLCWLVLTQPQQLLNAHDPPACGPGLAYGNARTKLLLLCAAPPPLLQVLLAEYGLGAIALYYLTPALLGGFVGSLRGFAGEVTAAQVLDLLASDGSAVLIDIRTEVRGCTAAAPAGAGRQLQAVGWRESCIEGKVQGMGDSSSGSGCQQSVQYKPQ